MTDECFAKMIAVLENAYSKKISVDTCEVYFTLMQDVPDQLGYQAALKCMTERNFFPTIAELRKSAAEIGTCSLPSAEAAWDEVHKQIRYVGNYRIPNFSHGLIERVVKMMGWRELCCSENPSIDRAQFIKYYNNYRNREVENLITPTSVKELGRMLAGVLPQVDNPFLPTKEAIGLSENLSIDKISGKGVC